MGGRGRDSGVGARQTTLEESIRQQMVTAVIQKSLKLREALGGQVGGSIAGTPQLFKKCACCGEYVLSLTTVDEVCPICNWINDEQQNRHPNSLDGKNLISLTEARAIYREIKTTMSRGGDTNGKA